LQNIHCFPEYFEKYLQKDADSHPFFEIDNYKCTQSSLEKTMETEEPTPHENEVLLDDPYNLQNSETESDEIESLNTNTQTKDF